ncbi:MAG TPA: hypothetical protein VFU02_10040 [Polyangiaceae bacterium]|nr:hypothetical protein [Polyangiaceae bacterium]
MVEESAIATLFQAPLEQFVTVRKQLAAELKAAGNPEAAGRFAKLKRPTLSAWAVNQLWWHEREAFDALFAHARRMSEGDLSVAAEHRRALGELREAARRVLTGAGHPANEATLRRIMTTLAALAAVGGFDPDRPGAIERDRDPPGFEALALPTVNPASASSSSARGHAAERVVAQAEREREAASRAAAAKAAAERAERLAAERQRLETELAESRQLFETRRTLVAGLTERLEAAKRELDASRDAVSRLEQSLAALREH